jgi:hypothetical protein
MYEILAGFVLAIVGYWLGYRKGEHVQKRRQSEFVDWVA